MELSFITYNIHKGIGTDRLYKPERIIAIFRDLEPDFLAFQEVPHSVPHAGYDDLARVIAEELGMFYVSSLNVRLKHGAYGNAIFSKFPVRSSSNMNITWSIKKPRGCLNAFIRLPDKNHCAIMNFHLGLSGIERRKQIQMILRSSFLNNHIHHPLIILGDSNDPYNRLYRMMNNAGFLECGKGKRERKTFPSFAPIWKLDRIFYSSKLLLSEHRVIKNTLSRTASDHLPVYARFRLL